MGITTVAWAGTTDWVIESTADWAAALDASPHVEIRDGLMVPTEEMVTVRSRYYATEQESALSWIEIVQSPAWDNWQPRENIGPITLGDAPVMLRRGPQDYWMFGRYFDRQDAEESTGGFEPEQVRLEGFDHPVWTTPHAHEYDAEGGRRPRLGGYHAWQSRDMETWVHHGPITTAKGKWMTTAEYVDGRAYFYYDFPNDQDPHLYIDEDLTDGLPGRDVGLVFADPSHGSDCAVIRDLDGSFHVIAEDWSPINAQTHAWDSPLAVHARSPDGEQPFVIQGFPVDHRTEPTGEVGTYLHPHWVKEDPANYVTNVAEYAVHAPEQDAYGDWAAVAIGGRYYLFADYDPADGHHMSVGRFTAAGIGETFEWCGHVGQGHPDPDIMFAEGRFYLATQQRTDFVSPGPWVEQVEVRVGVDTDRDGGVDHWSDWEVVRETYAAVPGFAKQVAKEPARLSLGDLPSGWGFQFEVRLTDTTNTASRPVLDTVRLSTITTAR